ncbi:hypothetical protein PV728_01650 [Streptomyces europaeiscabiei]|uniref:hypothetical protein n=1 Tax=Streptomyces europaeiscabiei TaxID=146819 RepID=UPI0029BB2197|nr:hypothetical protein [Streptomyces europaeiscabiei]MDX3629033.1 hypothetical protein [Streptomyces europaeiscabiei]MDX3647349.1 hypothetical protein [Streptomyces europaeiscabiei]
MSHQPHPQQPAWGPPPRPPKKKTHPAAIAGIGCLGIVAMVTIGSVLTSLTGSDSSSDKSGTSAPAKSSAPELTDEQRASIRADAGLPPTPNAADWAAYIKALDAIDPDIVHGKEDKAVSRGINTCSGFKRYPDDRTKQVNFTKQRFTSPTHPEGRDTATAEKILDTAHKHICPDY